MNQKTLLIGRHGKVKRIGGLSTNELLEESLEELYQNVVLPSKGLRLTKERVFARHSSQKRTLDSAKAILIGLLQDGDFPRQIEDLDKYDMSGIDISEDSRLNAHYEDVNLEIAKKSLIEVTEHWLKNRDASVHGGKTITPYTEIRHRIQGCIKDGIYKLVNENRDLGVIIGHEPYLSIGISMLIEASTGKDLVTFPGGTIDMGEFAKVVIEEDNNLTLSFRNATHLITHDFVKD